MMNIKFLIMILSFIFSTIVMAYEEKSIDQKLNSLKLEKMQAESMVATMLRKGHMNDEEATRIKREIASVKDQDSEVIKSEALDNFKSQNSFANK